VNSQLFRSKKKNRRGGPATFHVKLCRVEQCGRRGGAIVKLFIPIASFVLMLAPTTRDFSARADYIRCRDFAKMFFNPTRRFDTTPEAWPCSTQK
jgi:hypothetical protein